MNRTLIDPEIRHNDAGIIQDAQHRAVWVGTGGERGALDHDGHADFNAPKDLHEIDTGAVLIRNTARAGAPGRAHEG